MRKELIIYGKNYGMIGRPVFKDSLGKQLCVGDLVIVVTEGFHFCNFIVKDCVYGWELSSTHGKFEGIKVYKAVNYTDIEKLDKTLFDREGAEIKKEYTEMTKEQIEKELGYRIKIVD